MNRPHRTTSQIGGSRRLRPAGFTVPEMLAVVAIVIILLSLLLPSLGKSRESARMAICVANYHSKAMAMIGYATSNKNVFAIGDKNGPYYLSLSLGRTLREYGLATNDPDNPADIAGYYTDYKAPRESAWLCPNESRVLLFHYNSAGSVVVFNIYPNFPTTGLKGNPLFYGQNSPRRISDPRGPIMIESQRLLGGQPRLNYHFNSMASHAFSDGSAFSRGLEDYPKTTSGAYSFNMNVWGSGDNWYWLWAEQ